MKEISSRIVLLLFVLSVASVFDVQPVRAWTGTVYIRSDGSVDPPDAPIQRNGDIYTLTGDIITAYLYHDGIGIQRNNMTLDGNGHTLQGQPVGNLAGGRAITCSGLSNITIRNLKIVAFDSGIVFSSSSNISIFDNYLVWRWGSVIYSATSHQINVSGNYVSGSPARGGVSGGVYFKGSSNNTISGNTFTGSFSSFYLDNSSDNSIYHNNFMGINIGLENSDFNYWDEGYPSGGNYWSSQPKTDRFSGPYQNEPGSDGICDTPFVLSPNSQDHYPLVFPFNSPPTPPVAEFSVGSPSMPMRVQDSLAFNVTFWLPGWNGSHVSPVKEYRWDFGDGNVTSIIETLVAHTYTHPQTYNVTLTTVDNKGLNSSYSQVLEIWMPTSVLISTGASSTFVGYAVDINGTLHDIYGNGLEGETIILQYTFLGADAWVPISSDMTDQLGDYDIMWIPPATGYFTIKAKWIGNSTHLGADNTVSLSSIPYQNQYVFSVESNSTVSAIAFNSTSSELSFAVDGDTDTRGYVKATIAKSLIADIAALRVYIDGSETEYSVDSLSDAWVLAFTYTHSVHHVTIDWTGTSGNQLGIAQYIVVAAVIALLIASVGAVIVMRRKRRLREN